MPFRLLKYLQPTHYFQRLRTDGFTVFPIARYLPQEVLSQLTSDMKYASELATRYDLSWQAIQQGFIGDTPTYDTFEKLPLVDEYRFLRKNFHWAWVWYVFVLRLLSFHHPIKEFLAFWKEREVRKPHLVQDRIAYDGYSIFQSPLLSKTPFISIVIPTLNRYVYLQDVFKDLEQQTYQHFEVLVVDQTEDYDATIYEGWSFELIHWRQAEKALWRARNEAIERAKGDFILLYDDDSRVDSNWIEAHLKGLDYFNADISSGVSISQKGARVPLNYQFFRISDQLDTGNVLLKKEVFLQVGLFDRQFEKQRMGDGEFGMRCYLAGFSNVSNPHAKRLHLKVGTGGLREMGSWDAFRPKHWLAPRPIPSVIYYFKRYFGTKASIYSLVRTVPFSVMPYQFKKNRGMMVLGGLISLLLLPLVLVQVGRSWYMASQKIKEGPKVEKLGDE
ncbi:glycosyltransferase family 2 protein [Mangrovimonas sp. CR14]|uniref:glycosyltransferase family 2 protein n=1 Tax=Mangrovimonas sp. CR14 TaxID=2706120 RepID=UPI00141E9F70|nr:glycosyltransferase family A protein [Mangrovimonas sp. CR14]NIK92546.1 glycosyltransferase family 2 protein [Mangrovimonas sp. CR14]